MKRLIFLLLLAVSGLAQTVTTGIQNAPAGSTVPVNTSPAYLYFWDCLSATVNYGGGPPAIPGTAPPGASPGNMNLRFSAAITANPSDSNINWLYCPVGFSIAEIFNENNSPTWGSTLGKGMIQLDWMYDSPFVPDCLIMQLDGKSIFGAISPFDTEDGVTIDTETVGAQPGIKLSTSGIQIQLPSPAASTRYTITRRWNRLVTNPTGVRTEIIYVTKAGVTASAYGVAAAGQPEGMSWHNLQPGNDVTTACPQWTKNVYVYDKWNFDLPVNLWLNMSGASVAAAGLTETGASRFSISSAASMPALCTVNLATDSSTTGLAYSLNGTTQSAAYRSVGFATSRGAVGFKIKVPNIASGTSNVIGYTSDGSGETRVIIRLNLVDVAGTQSLTISGTTTSSSINVTPGVEYDVTLSILTGSVGSQTQYLIVKDAATGALIGKVTCTNAANARQWNQWKFGCDNTTTSQGALDVYFDNFVADVLPYNSLPEPTLADPIALNFYPYQP